MIQMFGRKQITRVHVHDLLRNLQMGFVVSSNTTTSIFFTTCVYTCTTYTTTDHMYSTEQYQSSLVQ